MNIKIILNINLLDNTNSSKEDQNIKKLKKNLTENNLSKYNYDMKKISNFQSNNTCEESENETENDIELYAESEQILNFKNSMVDLNYHNPLKNNDFIKDKNNYKIDQKEDFIFDNKCINKNNNDFNKQNNNFEKEFIERPEPQTGFKKLINKKNSTNITEEVQKKPSSDKKYEKNNDRINVHQSAMANQYNIKIGEVDLNDHFFKEKINYLEEENKNLRERLRSVKIYKLIYK